MSLALGGLLYSDSESCVRVLENVYYKNETKETTCGPGLAVECGGISSSVQYVNNIPTLQISTAKNSSSRGGDCRTCGDSNFPRVSLLVGGVVRSGCCPTKVPGEKVHIFLTLLEPGALLEYDAQIKIMGEVMAVGCPGEFGRLNIGSNGFGHKLR